MGWEGMVCWDPLSASGNHCLNPERKVRRWCTDWERGDAGCATHRERRDKRIE